MDIDIKFSFEMLGDPTGRRARGVFSLLCWIFFQKTLDFLFDLLGDLRRASVSLSVIESRRPFLVEPVEPFIDHWAGHVVNLRDLRSRVSSIAQENDVSADRYPADFLAPRPASVPQAPHRSARERFGET